MSDAIVIVGSKWHDPEFGGQFLCQQIAETGLSAAATQDRDAVLADRIRGKKLAVFYCEGHGEPEGRGWMTDDHERAVVEFVREGGGFIGVHGATVWFKDNPHYTEMIGGTFQGHGKFAEFPVKVVNRQHPITAGVEDYTVEDEPYVVEPGENIGDLLLTGEFDGKSNPLGWAKEFGKGRVVYLANGHDRRSLDMPAFKRLFANAVRWVCRREA